MLWLTLGCPSPPTHLNDRETPCQVRIIRPISDVNGTKANSGTFPIFCITYSQYRNSIDKYDHNAAVI